MKFIIYIFTVHVLSEAAVFIEGPKARTHAEGSNITLTCHTDKQGKLRWTDVNESQLIFYGSNKETEKRKYTNFDVSSASNYSNMSINQVSLEDEGTFSCGLIDDEAFVSVTIEAIPELRLFVNSRNESVPSEKDEEARGFYINCTAVGAKPNVSVQFKIGEEDWQPPSSYKVNHRSMLHDTVAMLYYYLPDGMTNVNVECRTQGQISVPPVHTSYELSAPVCTLQIHKSQAKCQCRANPEVHQYKLTIGTDEIEANETSLLSYPSSRVTCFGTSAIGIGTSNTVLFKNGLGKRPLLIVVLMLVIFITSTLIIIILIYRNRSTKRRKKLGESQEEPSGQLMEEYRTSEDQPKHGNKSKKPKRKEEDEKSLQNEFEALKVVYLTTLPCEWEIFAIKILGMSVDHVRHISEKKKDKKALIEEVISSIPKNDITFIRRVFHDAIPRNKRLCKEFGLKVEKKTGRYHFRGFFCHPDEKRNLELVGQDERLPQALRDYANFIGLTGKRILEKEYSKTMKGNTTVQDVRNLAKDLDKKLLFRVSKVVEDYANLMEGEITVMKILGNDWEIFGTEVMEIPEDKLFTISKEKTTPDQIQKLVNVWESLLEEDLNASVIYDLSKKIEELNKKVFEGSGISDDYINSGNFTSNGQQQLREINLDFMKILDSVDYTGERPDGLSNEDFVTTLQGIASVVGKTGAFKVLKEYNSEKEYRNVDNPGYMMIEVLLNKNELRNDYGSLKQLRDKLCKLHLYRATDLLESSLLKRNEANQDILDRNQNLNENGVP